MPSFKLCYFNAKSIAEMTRLLFADAGQPFEDERYSMEEWPQHKSKMLFNQVPVLFVDGEQIAHSRAAFRYVARKFNYLGNDDVTAAKIDMWIEVLIESMMQLKINEEDEKIKAEKTAAVMKDIIIPKFQQIEELIQKVYIFGENMTALDVIVYTTTDTFISHDKAQFLETLPKIKAMRAAIEARPRIAKYMAERPKTER